MIDSINWNISSIGASRLFSKEILTPSNRKHCAAIIGYEPQTQVNDFLQTKLLDSLKKDSIYEFTIEVNSFSNCHRNFIKAPQITFLKNQQTKFYSNDLKDYYWINSNYNGFIIDTLGWIKLKYIYKAIGNERYVLIGNPLSINKTKVLKIKSLKKCNSIDGLESSKYVINYFITNCSLFLTSHNSLLLTKNDEIIAAKKNNSILPTIDTMILPEILFASDSFTLNTISKNYLDSLFFEIKNSNFSKIIIEGNTDSHGSFEYNKQLSFKRATYVANYLKILLLTGDNKIYVYGNADSKPIANNLTEDGRKKNRRVEIFIFK